MSITLEVTGLSVRFMEHPHTRPALSGVTFCVGGGETLVLVGESGSGKSVLCRSLTRLFLPGELVALAGSIRITGREVIGLTEEELRRLRAASVRYVFQDPAQALNPIHSVRKHFRLGSGDRSTPEADPATLLRKVGLEDTERVLEAYPCELSGGMAQRVLIALALAARPSLLLADEPTSALDASLRFQILDLLQELTTSAGMGLLLVTHDLEVARVYGIRTAVLYRGQIVESALTVSLFGDPLHPYTRLLLSALLRPEGSMVPSPGGNPGEERSAGGCAFFPLCPKKQDLCAETDPPISEVRPSHEVRCHFWK